MNAAIARAGSCARRRCGSRTRTGTGSPRAARARRGRTRRRVLDQHGLRDVHDRHGRDRGQRVGHVAAAGPDLVDLLEGLHEARREGRDLPPPQPDRVAAREEVGPLSSANGGSTSALTQIRLMSCSAWPPRAGPSVSSSPLCLAHADRRDRDAVALQRAHDLPRGLADAQHGAEVARDVDAQRRARRRSASGARRPAPARPGSARRAPDRLRPRDVARGPSSPWMSGNAARMSGRASCSATR